MKKFVKNILAKKKERETSKKEKAYTQSISTSGSVIENARNSAKRQNTRINKENTNVRKSPEAKPKNTEAKAKNNAKLLAKAQRDVELSTYQKDYTNLKRNMMWFTSAIGILACMAIICMVFLSITNYIMDHEYFDIDNLVVNGASHFSEEEIKQISGIAEGTNSFNLNINAIKSRMFTNPWIEDVEIIRKLPRSVEINIKERIAQFLIVHENTLFYVDTNAQLISPITLSDFKSLPLLDIGDSPQDALEVLPLFIKEMRQKEEDFPFSLSDMAWLRVSASNGIEMFWEERSILIAFDTINIEQNVSNIQFVLKDLIRRNELAKVSEIHAGNGQAWFVYK